MSHRPRKRFGQNFLHDPYIIENIVNAINPRPGELLIEIGPGQGAITFPVLQRAGKMSAIELDRDLVKLLSETHKPHGELNLISQDALKSDFSEFGYNLRIIGNLPYNISSPLLFHLLSFRPHIQDMHFMLQKEVVDRMAAQPGSKTYGRLSVMIQTYCDVSKLLSVPPGAFNPPPAVDSAIVRLIPKTDEEIPEHDAQKLSRIVSLSFSQRRKTLRNNLKNTITAEQIESCNISPSARAETLKIHDFILLSHFI